MSGRLPQAKFSLTRAFRSQVGATVVLTPFMDLDVFMDTRRFVLEAFCRDARAESQPQQNTQLAAGLGCT